MRILQISSATNFGGGERHFVDLCKGLTDNGHEVFIALRSKNEWQKHLDFLPADNIHHLSLANSIDVVAAVKLARLIRSEKIQIVHAHLSRDYPVAGLAVRFCPKARLVLSRHVLFPMKNFNKFALTNVSRVIAVSPPTELQLKKIFPAEKITVIPHGIDTSTPTTEETDRIRREFRFENNIPYDVPLIGTVGELSPLKGQREFILAADLIKKKFPQARFLSSGKDNSYSQNHRRELKRLVKIMNLGENFVWLDWVEDMAPLYAALDIFVSASHIESFGLAISEAMGSSNAVVATETDGAKVLIKDGYSGALVPIDNAAELAGAVCGLLEDPERLNEYGKRAREYAVQNLGLEKMIAATESLYKDVLSA